MWRRWGPRRARRKRTSRSAVARCAGGGPRACMCTPRPNDGPTCQLHPPLSQASYGGSPTRHAPYPLPSLLPSFPQPLHRRMPIHRSGPLPTCAVLGLRYSLAMPLAWNSITCAGVMRASALVAHAGRARERCMCTAESPSRTHTFEQQQGAEPPPAPLPSSAALAPGPTSKPRGVFWVRSEASSTVTAELIAVLLGIPRPRASLSALDQMSSEIDRDRWLGFWFGAHRSVPWPISCDVLARLLDSARHAVAEAPPWWARWDSARRSIVTWD